MVTDGIANTHWDLWITKSTGAGPSWRAALKAVFHHQPPVRLCSGHTGPHLWRSITKTLHSMTSGQSSLWLCLRAPGDTELSLRWVSMCLVCEDGFLATWEQLWTSLSALVLKNCVGAPSLCVLLRAGCRFHTLPFSGGLPLTEDRGFCQRSRKHKSGFVNSDQAALPFLLLQGMWQYLHTLETVLCVNYPGFLR